MRIDRTRFYGKGETIERETEQTAKHAHTLTHRELAILTAKPTVEPDRAKIKWPKIKWKRPRGKTELVPKKRKRSRTPSKVLREVLASHGRLLDRCEDCGQNYARLDIHHKDGNHNNNHVDNLTVLCRGCHAERHRIADLMGVTEWHIGTVKDEW